MRAMTIATVIGVLCLSCPVFLSAQGRGVDSTNCGDVNGDAALNLNDPIYLLNFLFRGGPHPTCVEPEAGPEAERCSQSADLTTGACQSDALTEYRLACARCANLESVDAVKECMDTAREESGVALEECDAQLEARLELCETLGETPYQPVIDPSNFVDVIDNPFFPLTPGTTHVYEKETEEGTEQAILSVTHQKREILGVKCTVVLEEEGVDGDTDEETADWFAQDVEGNVWHFGGRTFELEDGEIVGLADFWEAGVDGALPGIVMSAAPVPGEVYRQEFSIGEAENMARVLSFDESVGVPYGTFDGCRQTEDFTPLEPGILEHKFYASGVGLVLEIDPETGERAELIQVYTEQQPGTFEEVELVFAYSQTEDHAQVELVVESEDALEQLQVFDPEGQLRVELGCRELSKLGQSGFCLESSERSLEEVLEAYPEGSYSVVGRTVAGEVLEGEVVVSHDIPNGPVILFPTAGGETNTGGGLTGVWMPATGVVAYRVELEEEETGAALEVDLPAGTTSFTFPSEWLLPGTEYTFDLEAIGENGNRTVTDLRVRTAE